MLKAIEVSKFMDEQLGFAGASGTPIEAGQLKGGEVVAYKEGHQFQGLVARIIRVNADGTVDLKIQNSTRVSVPVSDLVLVDVANVGAAGYSESRTRNTSFYDEPTPMETEILIGDISKAVVKSPEKAKELALDLLSKVRKNSANEDYILNFLGVLRNFPYQDFIRELKRMG